MQNFQTARDALETSLNSSGSAMKEHEKWQKSLEAQILKLKASWQGLSQAFLNSDFLHGALEGVIGLVDGLTKLIDALGTVGTIGFGAGIFGLFKSKDLFKGILGDIGSFVSLAPDAIKSSGTLGGKIKNLGSLAGQAGGSIVSKFTGSLSGMISGIGLAIAAIGLIVNAYKNYKEEISKARQETIQASDEFLDAAGSFEQAYIKYSGRTDLTAEEEAELESAIKGTVDALGDKSSALQNVVNSSNDYVASLEAITKAELEAANMAAKTKRDNAELELKDTVKGWTEFDGSEVNIVLDTGSRHDDLDQTDKAIKIAKEVGAEYYNRSSYGYRVTQYDYKLLLPADADVSQIVDYYHILEEYQNRLSDEGLIDTDIYNQVTTAIEKMSEAVAAYESGVYDAAKAQYQLVNGIPKTTEEYLKMREAILRSDDIKGLSFDARVAIANALDSEYKQMFDLSSAEVQAKKFIGLIKGFGNGTIDGSNEIGTVETFLNMRTAVNNNECSVGEYLAQFNEIDKMTEKWSDEEKELLNTSLGLDTDTIKAQYEEMQSYLSRKITINPDESRQSQVAYNKAETRIRSFLKGLTAEELAAVIDIRTEIDWENTSAEDIRKEIEDRIKINEALNFKADIEIDTTALEALNEILAESASAMGLTSESIDSLTNKYKDLDSFNPSTLFEVTANGVKVNRDELVKLEKEYNNLTKSEVQKHLDTLIDNYNDVTKEIDDCTNASERARLMAKRETYADKIEELATYQAQLEGVTGAYQKWIDAQNTPEDYEGYEGIATSKEDVQDEIDRGFISNKGKAYIDLLSGQDLEGKSIDDYYNAWEKLDKKVGSTSYSIHDFFTINDDGDITSTGIDRFFKGIQKDFEGSVAEFNDKTGKWEYDFSQENLQKIQDEWGIGIEAIELLLEAAAAAGYDVDWGGILDNLDLDTSGFETLVSVAESAQKELNKLEGYEDIDFNFTTTGVVEATSEVEKARKIYNDLIYKDGKLNLEAEGAEQMQVILTTLLVQKQQLSTPAIMKVDTSQIDSAKTDVIEVINKAKELQTAYENYEIAITTGVDVEGAKKDLTTAIDGMKGTSVDVRAQLKLPTNEELINAADGLGSIKVGASLDDTSVGAIATKIQTECTPEVIAKVTGLDETAIKDGSQKVVYTAEHSDVDAFINSLTDISKKIIYTYATEGTKPNPSDINRNIIYKYKTEGDVPEVNGTANANGTANFGRAFVRGNWGIKGSGTALVGELGMETLVRGGHFYTIGDNGAEFIKYKQGDIIFNHKQTEELFKNGKVTSDGGRGRMFANGSAFADGVALWNASASSSKFASNRLNKKSTKKAKTESKTTAKDDTVQTTTTTTFNANATETDFSQKNTETSEDKLKTDKTFEETFDWIAITIERIEKEIDNLDQTVNNVYKSWSDRNAALTDEISEVGTLISKQKSAYDAYIAEANKVGLDESWASKVRNGTIDIDTVTDENLAEKIKDYQTWYEKALVAKDAIEDLKETEAELYAQRFENVQSQYDGILQGFEHTESMLDEYISQSEAKGHIISKNYYQALIDNKQSEIDELDNQQIQLLAARQDYYDAMIARGMTDEEIRNSEKWLDMSADIDGVTQAIEEDTTALIEYDNAMRDIDWEVFDLIQERISNVTDEVNFLIDLMSNEKLHNDDGSLTDKGMATMGLHGQNYNTYMYQANDYGAKVKEIDDKIASGELDGYSRGVMDKRQEYVELQREAILNAEDEKEAMRDLVEEGINIELDALQELIDKKNEELESEKDLYEYQKKVKEQTEEIASLEKQMAAYSGDNSEEARAKVQELKVSLEEAKTNLEETEYDKYISDTQQMLDTLYDEYEFTLNSRLDNLDFLVEGVIDSINDVANFAVGADGTLTTALGADGAIATALGTNATTIKSTLEKEVQGVGTSLSTAMSNIWNAEGSGNKVITMYGQGFQQQQTTTNTTLNSIKDSINRMVDDVDKDAQKKVAANKTTTSAKKNPNGNGNANNNDKKNNDTSGNKKLEVGDKVIFESGQYYYDSQGKKPLGDELLGKKVYITKISDHSWSTHPIHIARDKDGKRPLGWLKKSQISGYAAGKKNFLDNEIAWTQENGKEFIVRPSDGAILTPIAKGDSVLTSAASSNIWDMANSPAEFIKDNLNLGVANAPNNANVQNNITQNLDKVVFNLPNVRNYEQLLAEMQRDKNFERLIMSMTVDQIAGKSSLGKNKSIR